MTVKIIIGVDTDGRDDYCECCGYPFDRGDTAYLVDERRYACSKKCAEWLKSEKN